LATGSRTFIGVVIALNIVFIAGVFSSSRTFIFISQLRYIVKAIVTAQKKHQNIKDLITRAIKQIP